jgi:hypothetical protein
MKYKIDDKQEETIKNHDNILNMYYNNYDCCHRKYGTSIN